MFNKPNQKKTVIQELAKDPLSLKPLLNSDLVRVSGGVSASSNGSATLNDITDPKQQSMMT
jgi:hypothetical protein